MTYRISTVAELTGIPRNTLIAWERRYGIVDPNRHENGYRSYSEDDVARLLRIKNALNAGLKISEAVELVKRQAEPRPRTDVPPDEALRTGFDHIVTELLSALTNYRREDAERVLARLMPVPFTTRLQNVFFPVLTCVGDLWEAGKISVAQEHYASAVLRGHLASILLSIGPSNPRAPHAACTTFPGDQHDIASLALAIELSLEGSRVSYLGANLPADEVHGFVCREQPRLMCVSVIHRVEIATVSEYVSAVAPALAPGARLVLGGRVLGSMQHLARENVEITTSWPDVAALMNATSSHSGQR